MGEFNMERSKITKEQTEDAQSGEWITVEIKSRSKPTIKGVIRTPDSVTIFIDNQTQETE